jgi:anti-sigma factor ChrR (cupin superfamily)
MRTVLCVARRGELLAYGCNADAVRFDEVMFPYVALTKDRDWQLGPYEGVELMILHKHEGTGGLVVLRKFKAGYTIPAHTHPEANEWAYVLSGEWEESGATYTAGALFFAPKGTCGPHITRTEVISLTIFDGPLTVE